MVKVFYSIISRFSRRRVKRAKPNKLLSLFFSLEPSTPRILEPSLLAKEYIC